MFNFVRIYHSDQTLLIFIFSYFFMYNHWSIWGNNLVFIIYTAVYLGCLKNVIFAWLNTSFVDKKKEYWQCRNYNMLLYSSRNSRTYCIFENIMSTVGFYPGPLAL